MTQTTIRPTTQPRASAGPFDRAFGVPSMRITAMIGTGLSVDADGRWEQVTDRLAHAALILTQSFAACADGPPPT